jgi:hypothetical protein
MDGNADDESRAGSRETVLTTQVLGLVISRSLMLDPMTRLRPQARSLLPLTYCCAFNTREVEII